MRSIRKILGTSWNNDMEDKFKKKFVKSLIILINIDSVIAKIIYTCKINLGFLQKEETSW